MLQKYYKYYRTTLQNYRNCTTMEIFQALQKLFRFYRNGKSTDSKETLTLQKRFRFLKSSTETPQTLQKSKAENLQTLTKKTSIITKPTQTFSYSTETKSVQSVDFTYDTIITSYITYKFYESLTLTLQKHV